MSRNSHEHQDKRARRGESARGVFADAKEVIAPEDSLFVAAQEGCLSRVQSLLVLKADPNLESAKYGRFPLYMAALNNHLAVVQALLVAKAVVDPRVSSNPESHVNLVQQYVVGRPLPAANMFKVYTPLLMAAAQGHSAVVEALLAAKARPNVFNKQFETPVILAVAAGSQDAVDRLLAAKAGVDPINILNRGAAHEAAFAGKESMLRSLLDAKATVNAKAKVIINEWIQVVDLTVLQAALEGELSPASLGIVRLLVAAKVAVNEESSYVRDRSPLRLLENRCAKYGEKVFSGYFNIARCLVGAKADLNQADRTGRTPFGDSVRTLGDLARLFKQPSPTQSGGDCEVGAGMGGAGPAAPR